MTPHQVQTVLEVKDHHWLTGGQLTKYQALLLDPLDITLKVCQVNLSTLHLVIGEESVHQCTAIIEQVYFSRPDLWGEPLTIPGVEWVRRWQQLCSQGICKTEYAIE